MEERPGGKFVFAENNQVRIRNFSDLVIQSVQGERFVIERFAGWVECVSGSGDPRELHVLLGSKETERLAKGYWTKNRKWQRDGKIVASSLLIGWLLRGLFVVFF